MPHDTDKLIGDLKKDFVVIHKDRVRMVWAYVIIALVLGIGIGIGYVISNSGDFSSSDAAQAPGVRTTTAYILSNGSVETEGLMQNGVLGSPPPGKKTYAVKLGNIPSRWQLPPLASAIGMRSTDITAAVEPGKFSKTFTLSSNQVQGAQLQVSVLEAADVYLNDRRIATKSQVRAMTISSAVRNTFGQITTNTVTRPTVITIPIQASWLNVGAKNTLRFDRYVTVGKPGMLAFNLTVVQRTTPSLAECSDRIDNDGDGLIDGNDPACYEKKSTESAVNPQCSDGKDNDDDGKIDMADPGCKRPADDAENDLTTSNCLDGIDNDRDQLIDRADPTACFYEFGSEDGSQSQPVPQCKDGNDNDADGMIDYPKDSGCSSGDDNSEINNLGSPVFQLISASMTKTSGLATAQFKFTINAKAGDVVFPKKAPFVMSLFKADSFAPVDVKIEHDYSMSGDRNSSGENWVIPEGSIYTFIVTGLVNTSGWPASQDGYYYMEMTGFEWTSDPGNGKQPQGMDETFKTNTLYFSEQKG